MSRNEVLGVPVSQVVFSYSAVRDKILAATAKKA
jgi:hypothetical protein